LVDNDQGKHIAEAATPRRRGPTLRGAAVRDAQNHRSPPNSGVLKQRGEEIEQFLLSKKIGSKIASVDFYFLTGKVTDRVQIRRKSEEAGIREI
jgi:hypothetical protein